VGQKGANDGRTSTDNCGIRPHLKKNPHYEKY
jgi:hypothetical protein